MDREFLKEPQFNKANILKNVLGAHNFNGAAAERDLQRLHSEEAKRSLARVYTYLFGAATAFSLYNCTRLGKLSPSGRPFAVTSLAFFSFLTYASLNRTPQKSVNEPQKENQEEKKDH